MFWFENQCYLSRFGLIFWRSLSFLFSWAFLPHALGGSIHKEKEKSFCLSYCKTFHRWENVCSKPGCSAGDFWNDQGFEEATRAHTPLIKQYLLWTHYSFLPCLQKSSYGCSVESSSFSLCWIPVSSSADVLVTQLGLAVHAFFLNSSFCGLVWVQAYSDSVGWGVWM